MSAVASFNQAQALKQIEIDAQGEYLKALEAARKSPLTVKNYKVDLDAFRAWFGKPIEQADPVSLSAYFASLGDLSPASVARKQSALTSFFQYCIMFGIIQIDPMAPVARVKIPKTIPRAIDDRKIKRLFSILPEGANRDRLLITMLYETGMRIDEAINIQREDLDWTPGAEQVVIMGKGGKERAIPLFACPETLKLLGEYTSPFESGPLFVGRDGGQLSYRQAARIWEGIATEAGLPKGKSLHSLRHTYATNLIADGVDLDVAQKLLGHSDIKTTMRYNQIGSDRMRRELEKRKNRL